MTFKLFTVQLKNLIKQTSSKNVMSQVGKTAEKIIVDRTTDGFGVDVPEGRKRRLKGLKTSYKKQRRVLKKKGKLDGNTTPSKSNLTKSRQMLKSVDSTGQVGKATVFLNNNQAETKAQLQAKEGRNFLNLSKDETKQITDQIEQQIINDIKKKGL